METLISEDCRLDPMSSYVCSKKNPQSKTFAFRGIEGNQLTVRWLRSTIF